MKQIPDELLLAYIDSELTGEDLREVEAALQADPSLKAHAEFIRMTERSATDSLQRTAPKTLSLSVMNDVRSHAPVHSQAEKRSNGALYTFLALIGAFMGIALLSPSEQSQSGISVTPVSEWFKTAFSRIGDMFAGSGDMLKGLSIDTSDTMVLAVVAFLLLALLDMYVLRPLSKKNGHH